MNRERIYIIGKSESLSTFQYDNELPSLPLPKLEDTMKRYYETLLPFGTKEQLETSHKVIKDFQNGIGKKLQIELEKRAKNERNWLEKWWENYAYFTLRIPLQPYTVMAMPLLMECISVPETPEYALKALARVAHFTLEFWELIRNEKLRPASSSGGKIKYSSVLYRRFYSTVRVPGEIMDKVECHFKPISEGDTPHNSVIIAKGRLFTFDCLNDDGSILSAQQLLQIFEIIRSRVDCDKLGDCVPVLTHDDRTNWYKNRNRLREISAYNENTIKLIDGNILMITLDENEPQNYSDSSLLSLTGDFHSKWGDKTSSLILYKSGKICCIGEHSAYDGTISISYGFFIQLSLLELPEPDWLDRPKMLPHIHEIKFDLDENLQSEIKRVSLDCDSRRNDIIATHYVFEKFGKGYIKSCKFHPDAFFQVILQLAYYKLHNEFAPTYETALMRNYHNGRTETLRSCTTKLIDFIHAFSAMKNSKSDKRNVFELLKIAVNHHDYLMNEARKGNGVDRHLFGLWCTAYEMNIEIPEFYSDELYTKSGGGGNFVLSTSTLGYSINTGFVAPMVLDGYGVFYSLPEDCIVIQVTSYRNSPKTSAHKFLNSISDVFVEMKELIDEANETSSKL